jgi:hypothetical protein
MINTSLQKKLILMLNEDKKVREQLSEDGSLFDGYHPEMEKVHLKNAKILEEIIEEHGWPGKSLVGKEGTEAAWIIIQHAISRPDLQRRIVKKLENEVKKGEVEAKHLAMLIDRICFFEGKPQVYGTNLDWNDEGNLKPTPILDEEMVNDRRKNVGLPPIDIPSITDLKEYSPKDIQKRRKEFIKWTKKVGWRD